MLTGNPCSGGGQPPDDRACRDQTEIPRRGRLPESDRGHALPNTGPGGSDGLRLPIGDLSATNLIPTYPVIQGRGDPKAVGIYEIARVDRGLRHGLYGAARGPAPVKRLLRFCVSGAASEVTIADRAACGPGTAMTPSTAEHAGDRSRQNRLAWTIGGAWEPPSRTCEPSPIENAGYTETGPEAAVLGARIHSTGMAG